jgi:uncharacterized protein YcbK (DUF882 family)
MHAKSGRTPKHGWASRWTLVAVVCGLLLVARDAPARALVVPRTTAEAAFEVALRSSRLAAWADALPSVDVSSANTGATARLRLYDPAGDVDDAARTELERVAAGRDGEAHRLAPRVEQLLFKAAYHFGAAPIVVVSAWRSHAGKHTAGEAIDFKLHGVPASKVAAYLRALSRVGVGIYTHPSTQFVHVDVREPSYHWVDASASGTRGRERPMADRTAPKRDAAYTAEMDLPLPP